MENHENEIILPKKVLKVLHQLIDLIEQNQEKIEENPDPFVEYVHLLKNRFRLKNPPAFRARFIKGYEVLLKETGKSQ